MRFYWIGNNTINLSEIVSIEYRPEIQELFGTNNTGHVIIHLKGGKTESIDCDKRSFDHLAKALLKYTRNEDYYEVF